MKIPENIYMNVFFSLFIVIMIVFQYLGLLISNLDYIFAYSGSIMCILFIFVNNNKIIDLLHFLYCFVYLYAIALLSDNKYLLLLNIGMLANIMFSRHYYKSCILDNKQKHKGYFYDVNKNLKNLIPQWNWDYVFFIAIIVSLINFLKLKTI